MIGTSAYPSLNPLVAGSAWGIAWAGADQSRERGYRVPGRSAESQAIATLGLPHHGRISRRRWIQTGDMRLCRFIGPLIASGIGAAIIKLAGIW